MKRTAIVFLTIIFVTTVMSILVVIAAALGAPQTDAEKALAAFFLISANCLTLFTVIVALIALWSTAGEKYIERLEKKKKE